MEKFNKLFLLLRQLFKKKQETQQKQALIALDLDDCVFDFLGYLCFLFNAINGTSITPNDINSWDICDIDILDASGRVIKGQEIIDLMNRFTPHGLYAAMPLLFGADQAIKTLRECGCEIAFITARPTHTGEDTYLNLLSKSIPFQHLIFNWDKAKVINELSEKYDVKLFVDDKMETCNIVAEKCKVGNICMINKAHNKIGECHPNVKRIDTLMECVKYVK